MSFFSITCWWVGALFFIFSLLMHLFIWRSRPNQRTFSQLFILFLTPPLLLLGFSCVQPGLFVSGLLNLILSANYLAIYPAFQASSPSIKMLALLFERKGLKKHKLLSHFPKDSLLSDRYKDLIDAGLIIKKNGDFKLTTRAKNMVRIFTLYRKLLGLEPGRG